MVVNVIKRDGRVVPFDKTRITNAVIKAALAVTEDVDEKIAVDIADCVTWYLNGKFSKTNPPTVEEIQDAVEKILIENGHAATAKAYILYRAERNRTREMSNSLMKTYEDLTFTYSKDMDLKRENANINTDTAMGTMLKYGSEGAKKFNHLYLLDKDISEAHLNGDIHIHDLDFYALTETCVTEDTKLYFLLGEQYCVVTADALNKYLEGIPVDVPLDVSKLGLQTRGASEWTKVLNIVRHKAERKRILEIQAGGKVLHVTEEHKIPVLANKGIPFKVNINDSIGTQIQEYVETRGTLEYADVEAKKLKVGMVVDVVDSREFQCPQKMIIEAIHEYDYSGEYVYDMETAEHYFRANDILVHNCCQIPLDKLFKNGFSTGHGFLREPQDIRSYSALACIAIQSNQNDQHLKTA